jgi:hypothetical protein
MGEMEWCVLDGAKEGHESITAAIRDFERLGYLVQSVSYKNGILEAALRPPSKERGLAQRGFSD